jgi:hypothetical protein
MDYRPEFPTRPGPELRAAFRKHLLDTTQPETFPGLSAARPPDEGELVVIHHPIDVDRSRRLGGEMVPCPVCCPTKGKWLRGGTLIWSSVAQAIYVIGPRCSHGAWRQRLDVAINVFKETETAKRNTLLLAAQIAAIGARCAWIEGVRTTVARADDRQAGFARALPKLRTAFRRELKTGNFIIARGPAGPVPIGTFRGGAFMEGLWRLSNKLDRALSTLVAIEGEATAANWVDALAPSVRADKLHELRSVERALEGIAEKVSAAAAFASHANLDILANWARSGGAPLGFKVTRTARTFDLVVDDRRWQCVIDDIEQLVPLPSTAPVD